MKIICLLLCVLSLSTAKVHPRTGVNDDLDGVEGVIVDIPEYEDPEVSIFKLIAKGVMPVYVRDAVKDSKDLSQKNDAPHHQTDDIKKRLDIVITQLQEAKNKLENGNNAIYFDIDKSVLSLEDLQERLFADLYRVSTDQPPIYKSSTDKHLTYKASYDLPLTYNAPTDQLFTYNISLDKPMIDTVSSDKPQTYSTSTDKPLIDTVSSDEPQTYSTSTDKPLIDTVSSNEPLTYGTSTDKPLITSTDNHLNSPEQPLIVSTDNPLNGPEQPLNSDRAVSKYIPKNMPSAEWSQWSPYGAYYGGEMAKDATDDDFSSEYDEDEAEDKALIRKKWSYKLSGMF